MIRVRFGADRRVPAYAIRLASRLAIPLGLVVSMAGGIDIAIAQDAPDTGFSGGITLESDDVGDAPAQSEDGAPPDAREQESASWWQEQPDGAALRLLHAGSFNNAPNDAPAIALLFSGPFSEDGIFNDYLAVYGRDGDPVAGRWRVAASKRVLYFTLPSAGTYIVRLRAGLPDADQNRLPQSVSGPVHVP